MFMYLYENKMIFYIMAGVTAFSLIFEFINQLAYIRLSKVVGNITNTSDKTIKKLKVNYEEKCKRNEIVYSVDNLVDKYVNNFKYCGIKLCTIEKICGQLMIIVGIISILFSVYAGYAYVERDAVLLTIMLGIVCIGLLILFRQNVDKSKLRRSLCIDIVNFLENTYRRIENKKNNKVIDKSKEILEKENIEPKEKEELTPREKLIRVSKIDNCEKVAEKSIKKQEDNKLEKNELIDEILKEFLS